MMLPMKHPGRPQPDEHDPHYSHYLALVQEEDIVKAIEEQGATTGALLRNLSEKHAAFRYAEGKWSIKQIVGHVTDATRVFAYRALSIARGETRSLPGFDENSFVENGGFDERSLNDLLDDLESTRAATLRFLRGLPEAAWTRKGSANNSPVSVRALAWMIAGHERHHVNVLRERYLNK